MNGLTNGCLETMGVWGFRPTTAPKMKEISITENICSKQEQCAYNYTLVYSPRSVIYESIRSTYAIAYVQRRLTSRSSVVRGNRPDFGVSKTEVCSA